MTDVAQILVVDDEPANRRLLGDLVRREGYDVLIATGGREALEILFTQRVDVVLLDLMMPEVDGMAVLSELKRSKLTPALPIVVVTAHEDRSMRPEYIELNQSIGWICDRMGVSPELDYTGGRRGWVGDNPFVFLDVAKIRATGWEPRHTIRESIEATVDWLSANPWILERR